VLLSILPKVTVVVWFSILPKVVVVYFSQGCYQDDQRSDVLYFDIFIVYSWICKLDL